MHRSSLLPGFGRRRHHRAAAFDLDDRAFRRAIHQARRAAGVSAFLQIDLDAVQWLQRDVYRVDIDLAADDVAHPALGAASLIATQTWQSSLQPMCEWTPLVLVRLHLA